MGTDRSAVGDDDRGVRVVVPPYFVDKSAIGARAVDLDSRKEPAPPSPPPTVDLRIPGYGVSCSYLAWITRVLAKVVD